MRAIHRFLLLQVPTLCGNDASAPYGLAHYSNMLQLPHDSLPDVLKPFVAFRRAGRQLIERSLAAAAKDPVLIKSVYLHVHASNEVRATQRTRPLAAWGADCQ